MRLLEELKRRNVFRVGAAYVVLGWLVIQVTETISPALSLPEWTLPFVIWVGVIGLPFILFFAWAYEITPDGIKREAEVIRSESVTHVTRRKLDVALVVLLGLAVALISWDLLTDSPATDPMRTEMAADADRGEVEGLSANSIVVLPLLNMSAIADNEFFAGGVHEEILTNLSLVDGLRVVSRTTALRYLASDLSLSDIGQELGVRYIVEGSVRRIENHVRITVQLIDAADDTHLWARNYDRELVDIFATQSEVAREISTSIQLELFPDSVGTLADMPTRSVKAYDLYMKAVSIDRGELITEQAFQRQRDLLAAAVAEDPDFVDAWARLNFVLDEISRTIIQQGWFGDSKAERDANLAESREAARRAIDRAVALDPDNVMTLIARGTDFVAEQEDPIYAAERRTYLDRALEIDPENAFGWYQLGWWYWNNGRRDLAEEPFRKALELDPFHAHIVIGNHQYFAATGDEEMTAMLSDRLIRIAPELGEYEELLRTHSASRLESIITLFIETADLSLIDTYAEAVDTEAENFVGNLGFDDTLLVDERFVWVLQNQLDILADMAVDDLPEGPTSFMADQYVIANAIVLSAQRVIGRHEDAARTGRLILNATEQLDFERPHFKLPAILAHLALGNEEALDAMRDLYTDPDFRKASAFDPFFYVAFGQLDAERAVELLLEHKAEYPNWPGTDVIAINHSMARPLVTHIDMQAFYLDEGKWLEYLATRVPEYEEYGS
jgi:TolB-like protein